MKGNGIMRSTESSKEPAPRPAPNPEGFARNAKQIATRRLKKHARLAQVPLRAFAKRAATAGPKDPDFVLAQAWFSHKHPPAKNRPVKPPPPPKPEKVKDGKKK
jgi:hypothetical protein